MTDLEAEQVIIWYGELESHFLEFLSKVPLSKENQNTHLPLLAPLIVEAESLIDTIFRKEYSNSLQEKVTLKIGHFAPYYEETLKLSQVKSLVYQHPPKFFMPFKGWTSNKTGNYAEMGWWSDYNQIKHNRIEKYSLSTLGTTVTILCALQQVIASTPTFTRALWRHNLVASTNYPHYVGQNIEETSIRYFGMVETKLFATPIGHETFPDRVEDITPMWHGSKRLARFLGR